ncbi:hypothetical protein MKEN_01038800 [Mycena kentingensis (nom. inval.)]|nr:hypothetical protein MKEN_01038800 [Mycena kentingensis (nom. inval.)]
MSEPPTPAKLALDPGLARRRPRPTSCCKILCWLTGLTILGLICWLIGAVIYELLRQLREPQRHLYHQKDVNGWADSIHPLITENDTFDVAVTVWLRATRKEEADFLDAQPTPLVEATAPPSPTLVELEKLGKVWASFSVPNNPTYWRDPVRVDKPLFSDIVFRKLRLTDKEAWTKVRFQLPTARFTESNMKQSDLRATFMLLPSSSSLAYIKSFSSWMPDEVLQTRPLVRPWPFPSSSEATEEAKALADLALESFAISVPLLQINHVPTICASPALNMTDDDGIDGKDRRFPGPPDPPLRKVARPYLITRSQLRVTLETNTFNATAYNEAHYNLKATSCGQQIPGIPLSLELCERSYSNTGNLETRLEMERSLASGGVQTRYFYAPYLDTKPAAAGNRDIIPIPVPRENCTRYRNATEIDNSEPENIPEFMNVTWSVAFSPRSPSKNSVADTIHQPPPFNHSITECDALKEHDWTELLNGLFGHRFHEDAHPRRRAALSTIKWILLLVAFLAGYSYWWTRTTTVGISASSVVFMLASSALQLGISFWDRRDHLKDVSVFIGVPLSLVMPFIMAQTITRTEFRWRRFYPTLTMLPPTHEERRSERIDNRTSWGVKLGLVVGITLLLRFGGLNKIKLIKGFSPVYCPDEKSLHSTTYNLVGDAAQACGHVSHFSQFMMNHRSRTFAGTYRWVQVAHALRTVILLLGYVGAVIGRTESRYSLSVQGVLVLAAGLPLVWQAVTLPPVKMVEGEDEE